MKNIFKFSVCIFALSLVFTLYGCKGSGSKEETTTEYVFRPFITDEESENTSNGYNTDAYDVYNADTSETEADADAGTDSETVVFDDGFVAGGKIMLGGNKNKDKETESSSQKKSDTASDKKTDSSEKSSSKNKPAVKKPAKKTSQKKDEKKQTNVTEEATKATVEKETEKTTQKETVPASPQSDDRWSGLTWN